MIAKNNIIFLSIIVSICIFLILIYKFYRKMIKKQENEPVLIKKPINGKKGIHFSGEHLQLSKYGTGYTYSFWININDWSYRKNSWKHILHKGDKDGNSTQPGIWITPKINNIVIRYLTNNNRGSLVKLKNKIYESLTKPDIVDQMYIPTKSDLTLKSIKELSEKNSNKFIVAVKKGTVLNNDTVVVGGNILKSEINNDVLLDQDEAAKLKNMQHLDELDVYTFEYQNKVTLNPELDNSIESDKGMASYIKNVPLNRWTHIVVVVDEQTAEVYVDGLLNSTTVLSDLIKENSGNLYVNQRGGFGGMLTQLKYFNKPLKRNDINNITRQGPDPFMLPSVKIAANVDFGDNINLCPTSEN